MADRRYASPTRVARDACAVPRSEARRHRRTPHRCDALLGHRSTTAWTGFIRAAIAGAEDIAGATRSPNCIAVTDGGERPDVVGWHDAREIPNYWTYADRFVLQDHLFEGVRSWSLPAHLDMVSGWSASCRIPRRPDQLPDRSRVARRRHRVTGTARIPRTPRRTPGPTSRTCCTRRACAGGTSWRTGPSPTARTHGMFCSPPCSRTPRRPTSGTRCPGSRPSTPTGS